MIVDCRYLNGLASGIFKLREKAIRSIAQLGKGQAVVYTQLADTTMSAPPLNSPDYQRRGKLLSLSFNHQSPIRFVARKS